MSAIKSFKDKIFLLDITDNLVIDIINNDQEAFGLIELLKLHSDNEIPKDKLAKFITTLCNLEYKGYISRGLLPNGRMWTTTKKMKWHKFYEFKGWKLIGFIIMAIPTFWALYLQFIEIPDLKKQSQASSNLTSPNQLTKQDSLSIYRSIIFDTTGYYLDTSRNPYKIDTTNIDSK